jgi:hypothetical protein
MRLSKLSIGSAEGNDLVLIDKGVAAEQLEMTVKRSLFGTLIDIKALADGLSVNGRPIESGEVSESVKLPASLEIGAAVILLERPENENKNTLGKFWEAVSVNKIARVPARLTAQPMRSATLSKTVRRCVLTLSRLHLGCRILSKRRCSGLPVQCHPLICGAA